MPTAILSTHTGGFTGYTFRDLSEDIPSVLNHWKSLGLEYDIIISGYLGSVEQVEMVKEIKGAFLKRGGTMIVDPVLGDNGKLYAHFDENFVNEMKGLCRVAGRHCSKPYGGLFSDRYALPPRRRISERA